MVGATVEQAVVRAFAVCNRDKALGDDVKAGDTAYRLVDAVPAPGVSPHARPAFSAVGKPLAVQ